MAITYRSVLGVGSGGLVDSLTVTQQPTKTIYMEGDPLDLTGMKVWATIGPLQGEVTSYVTTIPAIGQPVPAGTSNVIIKYGNGVARVPITVYSIDEIAVTTQPNITEDLVGNMLDLTGLVVTGYANNRTMSKDITELCTFSPNNGDVLSTSGTQIITVTYKGLTTTTSIDVYEIDTLTVTSKPTKIIYKPNETLNLNGIVVTGSNSESGVAQAVTSQCTFTPVDGTVLDEEKIYTITVTQNEISTSFAVICSSSLSDWDNRGLEYNSWDVIQEFTLEGALGIVASVGDTKSFVLNGKTLNAEIVSINDGAGDVGPWYPENTVDFITKESYSTYAFNSTSTNNGGFPLSNLKTYLNNTIYQSIPTDLKDIIINKKHVYCVDSAGNTRGDSTKLWIPTSYEIFGNAAHSRVHGETSLNNKTYTLASLKKPLNSSSSSKWWLSSIMYDNDSYFYYVDTDETIDWGGASYAQSFPICFRIGDENSSYSSSLEDLTWTQISNSIKDGTFSYYDVLGDTKTFSINGKTYHAEVLSINDGTGNAGQWYPNRTVDFICTELYETPYRYNPQNYMTGGFPSSEIKETLENTIYPLFPSDLKDVIIGKSHSYATTNFSSDIVTLSTELWLLSYYEIKGTIDYSGRNIVGENQYNNKKYFLSNKIKYLNGQSSSTNWWLNSYNNYGSYNWIINSSGGPTTADSTSPCGVSLCFRIG